MPVSWTKLGMFTAVGKLYGTQVFMHDLRLSNVAAVLSTHEAWADIRRGTAAALSRWRGRCSFLANPAISWKVSFDFFLHTVGCTHSALLSGASARAGRPARPFRLLYKGMADEELRRWAGYLESRVQAKGWNGQLLHSSLTRLPRSLPQAHRWFLLKAHHNAPIATARLAALRTDTEEVQDYCCFCSRHADSLHHLPRCHAVLTVYDSIRESAGLPPINDGRAHLMLQEPLEGSVVAGIVAFYVAIWDVRSMCRRGVRYETFAELRSLVLTSLQCPWLVRCCPTRSRQDRRADRVAPPAPVPNTTIYRSDGACRGQGAGGDAHAGWGAAVWSATPTGLGEGVAFATARGYLGTGSSNNEAEYCGVLECLERALRVQDPRVVFEVDSMLVARQLAKHQPWACRSTNLIPLHRRCVIICQSLSQHGVVWDVRHIYREFNQTADTLSNQGIDEQATNGYSQLW